MRAYHHMRLMGMTAREAVGHSPGADRSGASPRRRTHLSIRPRRVRPWYDAYVILAPPVVLIDGLHSIKGPRGCSGCTSKEQEREQSTTAGSWQGRKGGRLRQGAGVDTRGKRPLAPTTKH